MFLSDHETETDLLYYEIISKTVIRLIHDAGERPISIGVHGDWGAGKSSILAMTKAAMEREQGVVCVWFNGWQFQGFDDAKTVLIERILVELKNNQAVWSKAAEELVSLTKRVRWFKVARLVGSIALTVHTGLPFVLTEVLGSKGQEGAEAEKGETAGDYLKSAVAKAMPQEMDDFRKEFEAVFKKAGIERLVVLLDDLDRCLPNTAIDTLEAIKLFLFVPHAVFVIGADEAMIEYAVRKHFPDLPLGHGSQTYARNYLEKLIQVPFRIPAMGLVETRVYVALLYLESTSSSNSSHFKTLREISREVLRKPWEGRLFDQEKLKAKFGSEKVPDAITSAITLSDQIAPMLAEQTRGNPRQVKRFLNALFLRQEIAAARGLSDEIKTQVLAKIMLVERFFEKFYDALAVEVAASEDGTVESLRRLEQVGENGISSKRRDKKKSDIAEWEENEDIKAWAKLSPPLAAEDLRPYILITRDRRNLFTSAGAEHEALLEKLLGSRLAVAGMNKDIKALRPDAAVTVFNEISSRIRSKEQFDSLPPGAIGLAELTKIHPGLQQALLDFAADLPISKLGPWVLGEAGWDAAIDDPSIRAKWDELVRKWAEQQENRALRTTARSIVGLRK